MGKKDNLLGNIYGRLTVIRDTGERGGGQVIWLCKCTCGSYTNVRAGNLKNGHTTSCGCFRQVASKENIKGTPTHSEAKNLVGKKFGRLTVLEIDKCSSTRNRRYVCQCDCGNKHSVCGSNLKAGHVQSCGCLNSETSKKVIKETHRWNEMNDEKESTRLSSLNSKLGSRNKSGTKGVSFDSTRKKWRAQLKFQGKTVFTKRFDTLEEAIKARKDAEEKYFAPTLNKYGKELIR